MTELAAVLPNLIVIGAGRAGTTSIHRYLGEHPEIFMAQDKELMFFVPELNWRRGLAWYESHFPESRRVRGESSPQYTVRARWPGAPERMAQVVPDAKLVYIVRDPIERMLSTYAVHLAYGLETGSLADAMVGSNGALYVEASCYWTQLRYFLDNFPAEQVLVVDFDEFRRDRADSLSKVFRFLDVDPDFRSPTFDAVYNAAPAFRPRRALSHIGLLEKPLGRGLYLRTYPLTRLPRNIRRLLTKEQEPPAIAPELRRELEETFSPEVAQLREFTGLPLATWSV